jgi:hypothetical protein
VRSPALAGGVGDFIASDRLIRLLAQASGRTRKLTAESSAACSGSPTLNPCTIAHPVMPLTLGTGPSETAISDSLQVLPPSVET